MAPPLAFVRKGQRVVMGRGWVPHGGAELWLVVYDPMRREVKVKAGENAGKTVTYVNLVRGLARLGPWNGRSRTYAVPADLIAPNLQAVAVLQGRGGGPILAAARN